jgi:hypothetical protein
MHPHSFQSLFSNTVLKHARHLLLTNTEWKHVEEKLKKIISSWKGKLLPLGGRLVLINSVLCNIVLHMIFSSVYPKEYCIDWTIFDQYFFWHGDSEKKKYRLAKWSMICWHKWTVKESTGFMTLRSKIELF